MKKKLEAELISIAHRILKLKNRAELDQLQAEALKLYEKISVLKFVEDNFAEVKPTISYSSAEETLEEIYGIEETAPVHANEVEASEEDARAEKAAKKPAKKIGDKESQKGDDITADKEEASVAKEEALEDTTGSKPEGDADPEQETEEYQASEEEKEETEDSGEELEEDDQDEVPETEEKEDTHAAETEAPKADDEEPEAEEPEHKLTVTKPEEDVKAMEEGAAAVFEKEDDNTIEEEEKAADAEVISISPDENVKTEDGGASFDFAFDRKPAPDEPVKQKEITFEDYHDYKEPEFVKKGEEAKTEAAKEETLKEEAAKDDDLRNWEPAKPEAAEQPKQEEKKEEPRAEVKPQNQSKSLNDAFGKSITLGLNDRIAFEKHLFGGSGEDLNRVLSQLTTINSYDEARSFIDDLVKPDYNNWKGKEEYEERFMALIEKKFS